MIIDIALGIVLAVIILRLLPYIIEAGMFLVTVFLALVVCGLLIYWGVSHVEEVIIFTTLAFVFVGWEYLAEYIERKTKFLRIEVGILTALAVFTAPFAWLIPAQDLSYFWFIPILAIWVSAIAILQVERNKRLKVSAQEMELKNEEG